MKFKSIQQANIDNALQHMEEARKLKNQPMFEEAMSLLRETLDAIENSDVATYKKYILVLDETI
jgi:hypothetical protein